MNKNMRLNHFYLDPSINRMSSRFTSLIQELYERIISEGITGSFASKIYEKLVEEQERISKESLSLFYMFTLKQSEQLLLCNHSLSYFITNFLLEKEDEGFLESITHDISTNDIETLFDIETKLLFNMATGQQIARVLTDEGFMYFPDLDITLRPPGFEDGNDLQKIELLQWYLLNNTNTVNNTDTDTDATTEEESSSNNRE